AGPAENERGRGLSRRGLLLRLVDGAGCVGQGEASPLPGYSPDSLGGCRAALLRVAAWPRPPLDAERPLEPQLRARLDAIDPALPAARFALETALLDLAAQARGAPLWALIGGLLD